MPRNGNTSTVTTKGSVVIPIATRRRLGMKPGTRVTFIEQGAEVVVRPATAAALEELHGILKHAGPLAKELLEERARDRKKENRGCR
jgi:AbrB family looped-hinge helix DNA binding protein